jgi:uridine kinase
MARLIVGIAGGSGSGKSTAVSKLMERLGPEKAVLLEQDAYYRAAGTAAAEELSNRNYDHPDAIEEELLAAHLRQLRAGEPVECPLYDFARHDRGQETRRVEPRPCILVDGILILASAPVREQLDLRVYVETDADIRLSRRMRRDVEDRGRTPNGVLDQWEATVRPMHLRFVDPSKQHAHLVIPEAGLEGPALDVLVGYIRDRIGGR